MPPVQRGNQSLAQRANKVTSEASEPLARQDRRASLAMLGLLVQRARRALLASLARRGHRASQATKALRATLARQDQLVPLVALAQQASKEMLAISDQQVHKVTLEAQALPDPPGRKGLLATLEQLALLVP